MKTLVSTKYQVVIPKEARKKLDIKAGQQMNVEVTNNRVVLSKTKNKSKWPGDYYKKFGHIWKDVDPEKYLDEERNSWD